MLYDLFYLNHTNSHEHKKKIQPASNHFRFEDSAMFETSPVGRFTSQAKARHASLKREMIDPFDGLEKYGINTGNNQDENALAKKRKR